MEYKYIIEGKHRLNGTISIKGSKNSALAIIVAAILAKDIVIIKNIPNISDVKNLISVLKKLNCKIKYNGYSMMIDSSKIQYEPLYFEEIKKLRASYYFMGAFLSLFKKVEIFKPGGCEIGKRPIDLHLLGFQELNCKIIDDKDKVIIDGKNYHSKTISLSFPSVGATINLILAAVLNPGTTIIKNVAIEPEIGDLIDFLKKMGAIIIGKDEKVILIKGVEKLHGCKHKIIPDRIEGGTYIIYACALANKLTIKNIIVKHQKALLKALIDANITMDIYQNKITIYQNKKLSPIKLITGPYPEFPTDLQQIMCTFLTCLPGYSHVIETIFENRYTHVDELNKLKAKIKIINKELLIAKNKLFASELYCKDLRGGAALLLACMMAEGVSILNNTKYIDRGYLDLIENLNNLGACIKKEKIT